MTRIQNKLSQKKQQPFFTPSNNLSLPTTTTFLLALQKKSVALYINRKNNPEIARTKSHEKRKKSLLSYVIGQRNSSKKLDSLDQSEILLCHKRL